MVTLTLPVNAAVFTSDEVATVVETLISEPEQKRESSFNWFVNLFMFSLGDRLCLGKNG